MLPLRIFSARISGVIRLSIVNARFGLGFVVFVDISLDVVVIGVVVVEFPEINGDSGVSGRFGELDNIVGLGSVEMASDTMSVRSSIIIGAIGSLFG